jgi:hypothetical protein
MRVTRQLLWGAAACSALVGMSVILLSMRYAAGRLDALRQQPAHASAEEAMRRLLLRDFPGGRVQIVGVGKMPGVHFVVARVWPAATDPRTGGENGGRREVGWHFTRMEHGWVYLPEDDVTAPFFGIGKTLLEWLPRSRRAPAGSGATR